VVVKKTEKIVDVTEMIFQGKIDKPSNKEEGVFYLESDWI